MLKKSFTFLLLFLCSLFAKDIEPTFSLNATGGVVDLVLNENKIYASTLSSSVDIFDMAKKEKIDSIKIPKIKDFTQNVIESKIYSVDILKENVLILSQGENGGRNLFIYNSGKLLPLIEDKEKLYISYAKFLDENHIVYALLSNQIFIYNIKNRTIEKQIQVSQSKFSSFRLNETKTQIIVSDESGVLTLVDTKNLQIIKTFENMNLDNVFQVDIKNNTIITAGQDGRCVVYYLSKKEPYFKKFDFLLYSAGLSSTAKFGGISSDEENNVTIFNTETKENIAKLVKNKSTITNILFINENMVIVSSEDKQINIYKLN